MPNARGRSHDQTSALFLTDGVEDRIRHLTQARRAAYDKAQAFRGDGQLVPASLSEEISANGIDLERVLSRYRRGTGSAP